MIFVAYPLAPLFGPVGDQSRRAVTGVVSEFDHPATLYNFSRHVVS
jgi:hypothetical protein